MSSEKGNKPELSHHIQSNYCSTRSLYRKSRKLTAVKVYSVANESRHLLVFGVPQINLVRELKELLRRQGNVQLVQTVTDDIKATGIDIEAFTDVFYVRFEKLDKARRTKKILDARNFYGGILHISYAPERETTEDLRQKLSQRKREAQYRLHLNRTAPKKSSVSSELNTIGPKPPKRKKI